MSQPLLPTTWIYPKKEDLVLDDSAHRLRLPLHLLLTYQGGAVHPPHASRSFEGL